MAKKYREIIKIDEDKCNGCGACVPGCKEGALQIIDGKARLVSEVYCDGLGACLGTCPQDAITIEKREAEEFDEEKAMEHVKNASKAKLPCGCPGMMSKSIAPKAASEAKGDDISSSLTHWPIQLALVPANAPYLRDADLVLLADCSAVAYANLHRDLISNRVVAMACPKLDDTEAHVEKLARVIEEGGPRSIEVVMMEVPCCGGLYAIAQEAVRKTGVDVALNKKVISVEGNVIG
jgi:NAD-dependent dihydropyrimidine dehydrogenase PreA subunit